MPKTQAELHFDLVSPGSCRDPLWRNLSSEILPCCSELRISLIWALQVSFAAGYLTFEIAETTEPVGLRDK